MLIKRKFLIITFTIVITISLSLFSCTVKYIEADGYNEYSKDIGDDYLLFESIGLENRTFRIKKSGYTEFVEFGSSRGIEKILIYKSGKLSDEDMNTLSGFIDDSGFFDLEYAYLCPENLCVEAIWVLSIFKDGKVKTVYEYGIDAPDPFYDVAYYLFNEVKPQLKHVLKYGTFIIAERKKDLKNNILNEIDLDTHPFIAEAISNIGWPVHVGSINDTELEYYITDDNDYFDVIFEGEQFCVRVYQHKEDIRD